MSEREAALARALKLAANRLDVLALDHDYGTTRRNIADEWAKEARAALAQAEAVQAEIAQPVAWVDERAIRWLADRKSRAGAAITTKLEPSRSFERPMPLYAAPQPAEAAK